MTNQHSDSFGLLLSIAEEVEESPGEPIDEQFTVNARSRYNQRIFGMMMDYQIDMVEAMLWDFESFGFNVTEMFKKHGLQGVETQFDNYMYLINRVVTREDILFYRDIFTGKSENYVLRKN